MKLQKILFLSFCFLLPLAFNLQNSDSPFEFFKFMFSGLYISALSLLFVIFLLRQKIFKFELPGSLLLILFITASNIFSYFFSVNPYLSMWGDNLMPSDSLASILVFSAAAFIAATLFTEQTRIQVAAALLAALVLQNIYGLLQAFGYDFYNWNYAKPVFGTFGSTVSFSTFLGCMIPLAVACFFIAKKLPVKAAMFFLVLSSNYLLLETGSRTPAAVSCFVQILMLIYFFRKRAFFKPLSSAIALSVAIACIYGLAFVKPAQQETLVYKFSGSELSKGMQVRTILWREALTAWKDHPFFGYGPETFQIAQRAYQSREMNQYKRWHSVWIKAHNHLVQYMVGLGVLGVLMHLLLFGYVVRGAVRIWKAAETSQTSALSLGFACGFIFLFLANLTAFNFITTEFLYFLLPVMCGLGSHDVKYQIDFTKIPRAYRILSVALAALFILLGIKFFNHFRGDIYYQLSYAALNKAHDVQVAALLADEALKANAQDPAYYCHMAEIETEILTGTTKIKEEAKAYLLDSMNKNAEACNENAINREHYFLQTGNQYAELYAKGIISSPEKSLESYENLMTLAPQVPLAYYRSALVYLKAGNQVAFEENLEKTLELKNNYLPAYLELFQFYYQSGSTEKKYQLLERFSKLRVKPTELTELCKAMAELAEKYRDTAAKEVFLQKYSEFSAVY